MKNFEKPEPHNPDLDQAHVAKTPEDLRLRQRIIALDEPSYGPEVGIGPRDDVVWGERSKAPTGSTKEKKIVEKVKEENIDDLLIFEGKNDPKEDIEELLIRGDNDNSEESGDIFKE